MSTKSDQGLIRVKEHIPYFGKGIDELVAAIRKIFSDNEWPQKITLEAGSNQIYLEKLISPEKADKDKPITQINNDIHLAIRNSRLEDYESISDITQPLHQIYDMFSVIHAEGLEVNYLAVGDKSKFQKWIGIRIPQTNLNLFGIPIIITGEIPDDVFVICGAPSKTSAVHEISFSVKGTL